MEKTTEKIVEISSEAADKAKKIMEEKDMNGYGIKIEVLSSQNKANYNLELSKEPSKDDIIIESNGIELFIHSDSVAPIEGIKIDWVKENGKEGFKVMEPDNTVKSNYDDSLKGRTKKFLDQNFPQIKDHGGKAEIEIINDEKGYIKIKLEGACSSCGISNQTLRAIKTILPNKIEEINKVDVKTGEKGTQIEPPA